MLQKDKRAKKAKPGYFFIRFKWFLKTKYRKEVDRINKMWDYLTTYCSQTQRAKTGYLQQEKDKSVPKNNEKYSKHFKRKKKVKK
jgi:hypothetical protein